MSATHHSRLGLGIGAAVLLGAAGLPRLAAVEPQPAAARVPLPSRDAQERSRSMARELVATALDVQLRQLEDNGLEHLPLHAEIKVMRGSIERLVDDEMQGVVDLLAKAESAPADERTEVVQEARRLIRHVTLRLSAERQMLLRRLKVADIAAQVRRLTRQESAVLKVTEALPQQPPGRREAVTLATLEQQRTVGTLFAVLAGALEDVRGWEGPVGAAATESLRRLRDSQADGVLRSAEERLAASDFSAAAGAQRRLLEILATLEERIERAQGVAASRADAAAAAVREMQSHREELREEIAKAAPTDAAIEALVEKQAELREEMNKLDELAGSTPELAPLVQQAKEAALESTEKLFEGDTQQAVVEEGKVVGSLAEIAERLQQSAPPAAGAKSAEQLDRQLDELRKAAAQARQPEQQQMAAAAQDTERAQAATKIAELSRAAEAIERAAATEREVAREADQAAADPGRSQPDAAAVQARQEQVAAVAEKVAEAIKKTAPEAAAAVEKARPPIAGNKPAEAAAELTRAAAEIRREVAETARELEAMTKAQMEQATAALEAAEQQLAGQPEGAAQAAAAERAAATMAVREAGLARQQAMAEEITAQAAVQEQARDAIAALGEQVARHADGKQAAGKPAGGKPPEARPGEAKPGDARPDAMSARDAALALQEAEERFAEAQRAIGEEAAAIAGQNELANEPLRQALAAASKLDPLGMRPQAGSEVGEHTTEPGPGEPAPLGTGFVPASPEATAEMIAGREAQAAAEALLADAGEGEAMPAAQSATELAAQVDDLRKRAAQMQKSDPARERVADALADAERAQAATKVAELSRAAEAIDRVAAAEREMARQAEKAAADPTQPQPAADAMQARQEKLAAVAEKVAEAIKQTAPEAAEAVGKARPPIAENKPGEAAEKLAQAAAEIRREAAAAAADLAEMSGAQLEQAAAEAASEPASAQEADRAAELAAAKEMADRLAAEMAAERESRDAIAERGDDLLREAGAKPTAAAHPSEAAREAAQAMRTAQETFAAAQEGVGEAAAALAGQRELGSQPLREALEAASQIAPPPRPQAGDAAADSAGDQTAPLGTGFVPAASDVTAEMIAGSEAQAAAEELLGRAAERSPPGESLAQDSGKASQSGMPANDPASQESDGQKSDGQPSEGQSEASMQQAAKQADRAKGSRQGEAKAAGPLEEQDPADKDAAVAGSRAGDAGDAAGSFEKEGWFAKLPPEMRQAIRAKSRRRAPRGYEEKLDRYFQNID